MLPLNPVSRANAMATESPPRAHKIQIVELFLKWQNDTQALVCWSERLIICATSQLSSVTQFVHVKASEEPHHLLQGCVYSVQCHRNSSSLVWFGCCFVFCVGLGFIVLCFSVVRVFPLTLVNTKWAVSVILQPHYCPKGCENSHTSCSFPRIEKYQRAPTEKCSLCWC